MSMRSPGAPPRRPPARRLPVIPTAIVAGILGGIGLEVYLYLFNHIDPIGHWTFVATVMLGPDQAANYVWLGGVAHYAISIGWALIYTLLATRWASLWRMPLVWGPLYGVIVMFSMFGVLIFKHAMVALPEGMQLVYSLIGHCIFYALPMALYVGFAARRS
jgi:hypothetical protein